MAKIQQKSEKVTPFGGIFHVREQFSRYVGPVITANTTYTSDTGKSYDFNTATKLNRLLVKALLGTGQLVAGESYDLDFDHQFIETEKYDAKMTYKKFFASEANKFERTGFGWARLPKSFMAENTVTDG